MQSRKGIPQEFKAFQDPITDGLEGDTLWEEYFLQGLPLFFRLEEEEKIAEVLIHVSLFDSFENPSLSPGKLLFPGLEELRVKVAEII